jgi:hypothetical protein
MEVESLILEKDLIKNTSYKMGELPAYYTAYMLTNDGKYVPLQFPPKIITNARRRAAKNLGDIPPRKRSFLSRVFLG